MSAIKSEKHAQIRPSLFEVVTLTGLLHGLRCQMGQQNAFLPHMHFARPFAQVSLQHHPFHQELPKPVLQQVTKSSIHELEQVSDSSW